MVRHAMFGVALFGFGYVLIIPCCKWPNCLGYILFATGAGKQIHNILSGTRAKMFYRIHSIDKCGLEFHCFTSDLYVILANTIFFFFFFTWIETYQIVKKKKKPRTDWLIMEQSCSVEKELPYRPLWPDQVITCPKLIRFLVYTNAY